MYLQSNLTVIGLTFTEILFSGASPVYRQNHPSINSEDLTSGTGCRMTSDKSDGTSA